MYVSQNYTKTIVIEFGNLLFQGPHYLKKKPCVKKLCGDESEEHEHGMGTGVNTTLLSDIL